MDTSALIAIAAAEPAANACADAMDANTEIVISAATLTEALIVAGRKRLESELQWLLADLDVQVIEVTEAFALAAAAAYQRWGKGVHPAALNFGDCFAYALAIAYDCPLLFVGNDFSQTDVRSVL